MIFFDDTILSNDSQTEFFFCLQQTSFIATLNFLQSNSILQIQTEQWLTGRKKGDD